MEEDTTNSSMETDKQVATPIRYNHHILNLISIDVWRTHIFCRLTKRDQNVLRRTCYSFLYLLSYNTKWRVPFFISSSFITFLEKNKDWPTQLYGVYLYHSKERKMGLDFSILQRLTSLKAIDFLSYPLRDDHLKTIPNFIQSLDLFSQYELTSSALQFLPPQLTSLNLFNCFRMKDIAMSYLPKSIVDLNLSYCYITDEGVKFLPSSLTQLNLTGCKLITDEGISSIVYSSMTSLNISYIYKITNDVLQVFSRLTSLRSLNLSNCSQITNEGISYLPSSLVELDVSNCSLLNNDVAKVLSTNLRELNVSVCKGITNVALKLFPSSIEQLTTQDSSITEAGLYLYRIRRSANK